MERTIQTAGQGEQRGQLTKLAEDLPLFTAAPPPAPAISPLKALLDAARPDELSPREALELLYRLKDLAGN